MNEEWFNDVYTRSTYKIDPKKKDVLKKYKQLLEDYPNYCHILRFMDNDDEYQLTKEETINFYYCKTCIKHSSLIINNSLKYCSKSCPYYFSYEEIIASRESLNKD